MKNKLENKLHHLRICNKQNEEAVYLDDNKLKGVISVKLLNEDGVLTKSPKKVSIELALNSIEIE